MGASWWRGGRRGLVEPAVLVDVTHETRADAGRTTRAQLRRVAAEALICSDQADEVVRDIRARMPLGRVAPRGGPLVRRFFGLRDELPTSCADPADQQLRDRLDVILHHHAMLVTLAMDLLAYEWRSPAVAAQVDALDGMGTPARELEQIHAALREAPPADVAAPLL